MTSHDILNLEGQLHVLSERLEGNLKFLEELEERKLQEIASHTRGGEIPDALIRRVEVVVEIANEICALLPDQSKISDQEKVVWSGRLSDLVIKFLGDNRFRVDGPNLIVIENEDLNVESEDNVVVAVSREADLPVSPDESIEALVGLEVKIYRASKSEEVK